VIDRYFNAHPRSVGETYGEHMAVAGWFALKMAAGAGACLVHAVIPGLFTRTGSRIVGELHERMVLSRARAAGSAPQAQSAR
jgi:hypothetical protein